MHNDVSLCESFSVIVEVTQLAPCERNTSWSLVFSSEDDRGVSHLATQGEVVDFEHPDANLFSPQ